MSSKNKLEQSTLLNSFEKMDKIPFKLFKMVVSVIDIKQLSEDNVVYLSKQDIVALLEDKDNDKKLSFKEVIEKMQRQTIFEIKKQDGATYSCFEGVEWNNYEDAVAVYFNVDAMPYLSELKQRMIQHSNSNVQDLETSFSSIPTEDKFIIDTMAELYAERIRSKVSQQELAERIGMKQPQVAKLERLESVPTLKTLNRYAEGLGLKLKIGLVPA